MDGDDFPEIPDFLPEEFFSEAEKSLEHIKFDSTAADESRFTEEMARRFLRDDASVSDFLNLLGFIASMDPADRDRLRQNLNDLANDLLDHGREIERTETPSDVLFIGSNGTQVVKGLHYSREVLGSDGPVILPSSSPSVIIGAYSDEFIHAEAEGISSRYDTYEEQSQAWEEQMAFYAVEIARKYNESPPGRLEDFLRDIE